MLYSSIALSCGAGRRRGSDAVLLWLWRSSNSTPGLETSTHRGYGSEKQAKKKGRKEEKKRKTR